MSTHGAAPKSPQARRPATFHTSGRCIVEVVGRVYVCTYSTYLPNAYSCIHLILYSGGL